jgi:hypothetical protein
VAGDVSWNPQLSSRLMPSGSIEEEDGVTALRHLAANFLGMQVHRLRVGIRHIYSKHHINHLLLQTALLPAPARVTLIDMDTVS